MRFLSIMILGFAMMMLMTEVGAKPAAEETAITDEEVNNNGEKKGNFQVIYKGYQKPGEAGSTLF